MADIFFLFLAVSFILAAFSRDQVVFAILYLFTGAYLLARYWTRQSIRNLVFERKISPYAFIGDKVQVNFTLRNNGWLPITWSKIQEALPMELTEAGSFRRVVSIGSKETQAFKYELEAKKRGYYRIGPFRIASQDILGLSGEVSVESGPDYLTIFPNVIPLRFIQIPSSSPLGVIRHIQPIFEDPSRSAGKREYKAGDSTRKIDWKASARTGNLQVKVYDPSIDLRVVLFLNLNFLDYDTRYKSAATELAIVTAASIAHWVIDQRLEAGIVINGIDAADSVRGFDILQPRKGRGQLLRILELLARSQGGELAGNNEFLAAHRSIVGWGTTLILITGMADDTLFGTLHQLRRSGIHTVLIICGDVRNAQAIEFRSRFFNIPVYLFKSEQNLDIWRK